MPAKALLTCAVALMPLGPCVRDTPISSQLPSRLSSRQGGLQVQWGPVRTQQQSSGPRGAPPPCSPRQSLAHPHQTRLCGNRALVTFALQNLGAPAVP